jgi:hypothetical protein
MMEEAAAAGISNHFIDGVLRSACSPDEYAGVFSADTIPPELADRRRFSFVTNLSRADEEGSHFVCVVGRPQYVLYIDPTGLPCIIDGIRSFLDAACNSSRSLLYNKSAIQDPVGSSHCGFYCILFVLYFDPAVQVDFELKFQKSPLLLKENDETCVKYIKRMLSPSAVPK